LVDAVSPKFSEESCNIPGLDSVYMFRHTVRSNDADQKAR
jgi:hypothetical protein